MTSSSIPVEIADQLKGLDLRFTRLLLSRQDGKAPIDKDFYGEGALAEDDPHLLEHLEKGNGYGMVGTYGDLIGFDADEGEELAALGIMDRLPSTLTDRAPNKPESQHFYYICPGLPGTFHFYHPTKTVEKGDDGDAVKQLVRLELGQVCAGRGHITGPGAPHWSGGRREVIDDSPLAEITVDDLRGILRGLAFSADPTKTPTFDEAAGLEDPAGRWDDLEEITRKARRGRRGDGPSLSERIGGIERVLAVYGWRPTTTSGDNLKGDIPGEVSKSKTALAVDIKKGLWFCHHHADSGGDAAALVALFEGLIDCRGKDRLRDPAVFQAVLRACEEKGLISPEEGRGQGKTGSARGEGAGGGVDWRTTPENALLFLEKKIPAIKEDPGLLNTDSVLGMLGALRHNPLMFAAWLKKASVRGDLKTALLETLNERVRGGEEEKTDLPEVPEEVKEKARAILETADPIQARCDYVAGTVEGNAGVAKAFVYSCSSAYMPVSDKLHADAVGASQGGKSVTVGAVHSTYPPENLEILTEASPKSVYYLAKTYEEEGRSFDDVILYINDARVEHIPVLKVFRDDGPGAPRNLTVVDGESLDLTVPGRPIVQSSSVLPLRDDEGQAVSRSFLATVADVDDDGEKKVRGKIRHGIQHGALKRPEADMEKAVLQQMGRILRDEGIRDVVIPFDSPEPSSADRRGTGQFIRLIKISAHENQFQRPTLEMNDGRRFVIATYADLQNAADLWFEFEEAQAFKINHKVLTVYKSLPTTEPDHYNFTGASPSTTRLAKDTGLSQRSVERYLSDLYDAGLISRKKAGAPGNPYIFWTTDQLRQKVLSQISVTGDGKGELRQIPTKNGCRKYLGKNCPDSLKDSFKAFFTNQDIIKKENVKGIFYTSTGGLWSVPGEKIISSLDFLADRVLNTPSEAADIEYLRQKDLAGLSEMPPVIGSRIGGIVAGSGGGVAKGDGPSSVDGEDRQPIADELKAAARREAEYREHVKTPVPKTKGRRLGRLYDVPRYGEKYGILYQPGGKALEYSPWAVNVAKSCSHGCTYCYGPSVARKTADKYRDDPDPKATIIPSINAGLTRALKDGCDIPRVHFTFSGDLYDPSAVEGSTEFASSGEMTRAVIEAVHSHGVGVQILTKGGTKAARDFDLYRPGDRFGCTLTFIDPEKSKTWEPGAALPEDRLRALKEAHKRGIETWASCEPVIDPDETLELIRRSHKFVDIFAVGRWNHDKRAAAIDWHKFTADVVELLDSLGCEYYIKDDLRRYLPPKGDEDDGRDPTPEEGEVLAAVAEGILVNYPGVPEMKLWENARERLGYPIPLAVVRSWLRASGYVEAGQKLNGSPLWNPPAGVVA